ncbi:MAG TPA: selenium-dependent molybdenum cofactor biosynthesis protein YqeB [Symbiobacteriaceae bacterium]|nr:selenium-dependent molybdenum cofactor biosynthesis protein YqeB [Symbiobacteriaceae bacterium]
MQGPVLVKGGGELATGVAWRLFQCGFPVVLTEVARPLAVRRTVSFCEAAWEGQMTVEGVTAVLIAHAAEAAGVIAAGRIPLLIDPAAACRAALQPRAVVDAVMAKRNLGTAVDHAPVVVALGPGFTAGRDCHAVVETQRGHSLGRVYYTGSAIPDTGVPDVRGGYGADRVVRAPAPGLFRGALQIGAIVEPGALLGNVGETPVTAPIGGLLRGLIHNSTPVATGLKIGDVDPVMDPARCHTISDKALAVAGGVLEALLHLAQERR